MPHLAEKLEAEEEKKPDDCNRRQRNPLDRENELLHEDTQRVSAELYHHFDEDRCRIQSKNIQQNLNMLHKAALNIVRIHKRETQSKLPLNGIMFRALMNPYDLLPLLDKN